MIWFLVLFGTVIGTASGMWLRRRRYVPKRRLPVLPWECSVALGLSLGVFFGSVAVSVGWSHLPVVLVFLAAGAAAAWMDLDIHRIPDWLTGPLASVLIGTLAVQSLMAGDWDVLLTPVLSGVAAAVVFLIWAVVGSLGLGDVKLSLSVGVVLGHVGGWPMLLAGMVWILIVAAVWAAILLARGATKSTFLPFAPAMVLGVVGCLSFS